MKIEIMRMYYLNRLNDLFDKYPDNTVLSDQVWSFIDDDSDLVLDNC
jgi:hypothetical protein